jgi:hypothetical protein
MSLRQSSVIGVVTALTVLLLAAPAASSKTQAGMTYLDNGRIRVGIDLDDGAKITFLAPAAGLRSGSNLVFEAEPGYYQANQDGAIVLVSSNTGREIYTKVVPTTSSPSPCECALEHWVTLDGNAVHVRSKLTNFLSDASAAQGDWNELPALYTLGSAHRLVTYTGAVPYKRAALREYTSADGGQFFVRPGPGFAATEHWAALVDDSGFGVGLVNRDVTRFAGIAGKAGMSGVNGYVAAASRELLDANATFDFEYRLVVGTVPQIRSYAYRHRVDDRPNYRFAGDRRHWAYGHATDRGFPIRGALRVNVDRDDPQLLGPEQWWRAKEVPRIYVRGRWTTSPGTWAQLFWGPDWSEAHSTTFRVRADGGFHSYRIDLSGDPTYGGTITGLRLDPVYYGSPGRLVDITCISWKPCPIDRKAEARLLDNDLVPFLEDFSGPLDGRIWQASRGGVGPTARAVDGRLELTVPATSTPDAPNTWVAANLETRCRFTGDYDLQVDFRLLEWPTRNGVVVTFGVNYERQLFRQSFDAEQLGGYFPPGWTGISYPGLSGSFRLVRLGDTIAGYYRRDGRWERVFSAPVAQDEAFAHLSVWTDLAQFGKHDVVVAFDNFRVNRGRMRCPS